MDIVQRLFILKALILKDILLSPTILIRVTLATAGRKSCVTPLDHFEMHARGLLQRMHADTIELQTQ